MSCLFEPHAHTSETSKCGHIPAEELVRRYKALGYSGIAITDHLHDFYLSLHPELGDDWEKYIDRYLLGYRTAKAYGERIGLDVALGAELRFPQNESDYLIYGIDEAFLYEHPFMFHTDVDSFCRQYRGEILIIQAHPFRPGCFAASPDSIHGIEVVNCNPRHDSLNTLATEYAERNPSLYRVVGSDTHRDGDEGLSAFVTEAPIRDSFDYKRAVESGEYRLRCAEFDELIVRSGFHE